MFDAEKEVISTAPGKPYTVDLSDPNDQPIEHGLTKRHICEN